MIVKIKVMKKNYLVFWIVAIVLAVVLISFRSQRTGSVNGSINPTNGANDVWLISAKDTIRGSIKNGVFDIGGVKPGTCAIVVEGLSPYKRTIRSGIEVYEGTATNVGEILLEQTKKK